MKSLLITIAVLLNLIGCADATDPVIAIETKIKAMEAGLAAGDSGEVTQFLAKSFAGGKDGELELNKDDVRKMLIGYSLRYKQLRILLNQVSVEVDEQEPALAYMHGTVAVSGANRMLPSAGGLYRISGEWQNFSGDWKLRRFHWE